MPGSRARDHHRIVGRGEGVLGERRALDQQGRLGVGKRGRGHRRVGPIDRKIGGGDGDLGLGLLRRLDAAGAARGEFAPARRGGLALGEQRLGARPLGLGALRRRLGRQHGSLRLGDARLLARRVQPGEHRPRGNRIAVIDQHLDQRARYLEADAREHLRLDRAEAEHTDRHVTHDGGDGHGERALRRIPPRARDHRGEHETDGQDTAEAHGWSALATARGVSSGRRAYTRQPATPR